MIGKLYFCTKYFCWKHFCIFLLLRLLNRKRYLNSVVKRNELAHLHKKKKFSFGPFSMYLFFALAVSQTWSSSRKLLQIFRKQLFDVTILGKSYISLCYISGNVLFIPCRYTLRNMRTLLLLRSIKPTHNTGKLFGFFFFPLLYVRFIFHCNMWMV